MSTLTRRTSKGCPRYILRCTLSLLIPLSSSSHSCGMFKIDRSYSLHFDHIHSVMAVTIHPNSQCMSDQKDLDFACINKGTLLLPPEPFIFHLIRVFAAALASPALYHSASQAGSKNPTQPVQGPPDFVAPQRILRDLNVI